MTALAFVEGHADRVAEMACSASAAALGVKAGSNVLESSTARHAFCGTKFLKVEFRRVEALLPGARHLDGVAAVANRARGLAAFDSSVSEVDHHDNLREAVAQASGGGRLSALLARTSGEVELFPLTAESYCHERCDGCGGGGEIACRGCNGFGRLTCTSCDWSGRRPCHGCGGSGVFVDTRGNRSYCQSCAGKGRLTCGQCNGSQQVTCGSCRGACVFACVPCGASGAVTRTISSHIHLVHSSAWSVTEGASDKAKAVMPGWMADGFPGARTPTGEIGAASVAALADAGRDAGLTCFRIDIRGTFDETTARVAVGDTTFTGAVCDMGVPRGALDPVLDDVLNRMARTAEAQAGKGDVAGVVRGIGRGEALRDLMRRVAQGRQERNTAIPETVTRLHGATSSFVLERLARAYEEAAERFSEEAIRSSWRTTGLVGTTLVAAALLSDVPFVVTEHSSRSGVLVAATVAGAGLATIASLCVGLSVRSRLRRSTGTNARLPRTRTMRRCALAAALGWSAILASPLLGGPMDAVRESAFELRSILGIPTPSGDR